MLSDDNISDTKSRTNFTSEDKAVHTISERTDDDSIIVHRRKRLRRESVSSSSETGYPIFTAIPPTKTFLKAVDDFFETPGPRRAPLTNASPIEYFNLFFTTSLLENIVIETNRYASQFMESHVLSVNSRAKKWMPTNISELKAFIAVLLEMGITKRPTMYCYWRQNSRKIPWFRKMFARDRFLLLLKFFHLVDNRLLAAPGHPDYDPCARFDMLIKHVNTVFHQYYVPHQQLSIDESLVGTHSVIKQYIPNKVHHKWGIKFWMLYDSITKYCLGFYCYKGTKNAEDRESINKDGFGFSVLEKLLSVGNYLNKGYHLFTDNFYTSLHLAKSLLQRNTYLTGTIRSNRKEIPTEAKRAEAGVAKYFANQNILMCSFRDKKSKPHPVILISSNANSHSVTVTKKKGSFEYTIEKPSMIHDYNKYMGEVDESDIMLYAYLDERRTLKFWKKVVFNLFGRMVLNSYILYTLNITDKKMSRLQFTSAIIGQIEEEWMIFKNVENETSAPSQNFALEKLPGRNLRQCAVCSNRKSGIKRSNLICSRCKKGLHGICAGKHRC